jgi:hypothetical protein
MNTYLPTFYDFCIGDECDLNANKHTHSSNLGHVYRLPKGMEYNSEGAKKYLGGSEYFRVAEIEVFTVSFSH